MAAIWTDAKLNATADAAAAAIDGVGVHTGDPGASGTANEASGGSYARENPTWAAAGADGALGSSSTPGTPGVAWGVINPFLPAGSDYTWLSLWEGATFVGRVQLPVTITGADAVQQIALPLSV